MRSQFKSLLRAIDILDLLEEKAALSVTEIFRSLGVSPQYNLQVFGSHARVPNGRFMTKFWRSTNWE